MSTEKKIATIKEPYGNIDLQMLEEFCNANGIPGNEKQASRVMKKYLENYVDEITYDNLGSIIGCRKGSGNGPKIMLSGHIDEVGFFVSKIEDNGYLKLTPAGGWWAHVVLAHEFKLTTRDNKEYYGMMGSPAPHGLSVEEKAKVMNLKDFFLDMGVGSKEEIEALGIRIGDMVTPVCEFRVMNNPNFLMAKAWDDRVGAAIATDVVRALKNEKISADIYAVGSVQEEVGLRGAKTAAYAVQPDIGIALDVTLASDVPNAVYGNPLCSGVTISLMDSSHLDHRPMIEYFEKICQDLNIDYNYGVLPVGGTDSGEIHKNQDGVISLTLSIPARSIHSTRGIIHRKDYADTVSVLVEFCKRVDWALVEGFKNTMR